MELAAVPFLPSAKAERRPRRLAEGLTHPLGNRPSPRTTGLELGWTRTSFLLY